MKKILFFTTLMFTVSAYSDWSFDFSRRSKTLNKYEKSQMQTGKKEPTFFESIFENTMPLQEVVVLNTEKGFVPSTLRLKVGHRYKLNVVNINEKEKNISFIMDAFSEHHATYFGKVKSFTIEPKKEGVFAFQCPETSAQGRLVVFPTKTTIDMRLPASEE